MRLRKAPPLLCLSACVVLTAGYLLSQEQTVTPGGPIVEFAVAQLYVGEQGGSVVFTVTLSAVCADNVTVQYETVDDTAVKDSDYTLANGSLLFEPGVLQRTITIAITNDGVKEPVESAKVKLTEVSGNAELVAKKEAIFTIIDNDSPPPKIKLDAADIPIGEAAGTLTVMVTLSELAPETVTVDYATTNGSATGGADFETTAGQLSFPLGVTSLTVKIPIINDTAPEPDETFFFELSAPSGAVFDGEYGPSAATITILSNDAPPDVVPLEVIATGDTFSPDPAAVDTPVQVKLLAKALRPSPGTAPLNGPVWDWQIVGAVYSTESETGPWIDGSGASYPVAIEVTDPGTVNPSPAWDYTAVILSGTFSEGGFWHVNANAQVSYTDSSQPDAVSYVGAAIAQGKDGVFKADIDLDNNGMGRKNLDDKEVYDKLADPKTGKGKVFPIYVNNFDSGQPEKYTHLDDIINGAADRKRLKLSQLIIRKVPKLPENATVELSVASDDVWKVRIFDNKENAVIGPDDQLGVERYHIPPADIVGDGKLVYYVECIDHGNIWINLAFFDAQGMKIASDFVNAVLVVDRRPGNEYKNSYFRVQGNVDLADVDGIEAEVLAPEHPKCDYNTTVARPGLAGSFVWIGAQTKESPIPDYWMQTGFYSKPPDPTIDPTKHRTGAFFELKSGPTLGAEHYVWVADEGAWPGKSTCKVALVDKESGKIQASYTRDDLVIMPKRFDKTVEIFKQQKFPNYQMGSELYRSVDQNAGTEKNPCSINNAQVWVKMAPFEGGAAFTDGNVKIYDYDTLGERIKVSTSHEWGRKVIGPRSFQMWDKVVEY